MQGYRTKSDQKENNELELYSVESDLSKHKQLAARLKGVAE